MIKTYYVKKSKKSVKIKVMNEKEKGSLSDVDFNPTKYTQFLPF